MRFADSDINPNQPIPWDQVRVGCTSDARWRGVEDVVVLGALLKSSVSINSLEARSRA